MSLTKTAVWIMAAGALAGAALGQQPADQPIARMVEKVGQSLARMDFKITNKLVSMPQEGGMAVCINAADGVFLTRDLPGQVPVDELTEFQLTSPGPKDKQFKADLMGVEPETGLGFLQIYTEGADGKKALKPQHPWSELKFETGAKLAVGQRVISVGLLGPQSGNVPYMGTGVIAALLRLPGDVAYVSGELTTSSSPVLNGEGKAIGIVGAQLPIEYRMLVGGRWAEVGMAGRQRTMFFITVNDFGHVLADIPAGGKVRRLPWLGVAGTQPVNKETAEVNKLTKPAVLIGQVVPDSPAAQAHLEQNDMIVGLNGQDLEQLPTPQLTANNFDRSIMRLKSGDKVKLSILRKGSPIEAEVTLAPMPVRPFEADRYYDKSLGLGAREQTLFDQLGKKAEPKGVYVIMVGNNTPAAEGQLRPGDLITSVNKKATPTVAELDKVLAPLLKAGVGTQIEFMIMREDLVQTIVVKTK